VPPEVMAWDSRCPQQNDEDDVLACWLQGWLDENRPGATLTGLKVLEV
jgi:hypothetical protein